VRVFLEFAQRVAAVMLRRYARAERCVTRVLRERGGVYDREQARIARAVARARAARVALSALQRCLRIDADDTPRVEH